MGRKESNQTNKRPNDGPDLDKKKVNMTSICQDYILQTSPVPTEPLGRE